MKRLAVKDYEGAYEVNEIGEVFSLDRTVMGKDGVLYPFKERKLAVTINPQTGYKTYSLWRDGKGTTFTAHRLVATAFVNNPEGYTVVNHLDGDKLNNHYTNLEWCTAANNTLHAIDTGLRRYTNRLSYEEFVECLDCIIAGETYAELCERIPYKVPFISTKLRKIARELSIEDQLDTALKLKRTQLNRATCKTQRMAVKQLTLDGELIMVHESINDAARYLGKSSSGSIANALNPTKQQSAAFGFKWERF